VSAGAHYDAPLPNGGTLSLNGGLSYRTKMYFSTFKEERLSQDALTLFNGNIRYSSPDEKFSVNLWTKNVTDRDYYQVIFLNSTSRQLIGQMGDPRTYGVTVGYNF
jgi:iron complex outermembrane receptor protein